MIFIYIYMYNIYIFILNMIICATRNVLHLAPTHPTPSPTPSLTGPQPPHTTKTRNGMYPQNFGGTSHVVLSLCGAVGGGCGVTLRAVKRNYDDHDTYVRKCWPLCFLCSRNDGKDCGMLVP